MVALCALPRCSTCLNPSSGEMRQLFLRYPAHDSPVLVFHKRVIDDFFHFIKGAIRFNEPPFLVAQATPLIAFAPIRLAAPAVPRFFVSSGVPQL